MTARARVLLRRYGMASELWHRPRAWQLVPGALGSYWTARPGTARLDNGTETPSTAAGGSATVGPAHGPPHAWAGPNAPWSGDMTKRRRTTASAGSLRRARRDAGQGPTNTCQPVLLARPTGPRDGTRAPSVRSSEWTFRNQLESLTPRSQGHCLDLGSGTRNKCDLHMVVLLDR